MTIVRALITNAMKNGAIFCHGLFPNDSITGCFRTAPPLRWSHLLEDVLFNVLQGSNSPQIATLLIDAVSTMERSSSYRGYFYLSIHVCNQRYELLFILLEIFPCLVRLVLEISRLR